MNTIQIGLRTLVAGLLACAAPAGRTLAAEEAQTDELAVAATQQRRPPNIVFIICDDLRHDTFGFQKYPHVQTPNIDKLAAHGITFRQAFVNVAICGPSRVSFWTGRYPGGQTSQNRPQGDFLQRLAAAGYQTLEVGKMHGTGGKPCFLEYQGQKRHETEVVTLKTQEFLESRRDDRPFCLRLGYVCTHAPFEPAPATEQLYRDAKFPLPPTRTAEHVATLPPLFQNSLNVTRYAKVFPPTAGAAPYQAFVQNYLRCVTSIDRSVGEVLALLDLEKLADNTVVIFTSDHGFYLGEHGFGGKWSAYEPSIRIPLIIRDPRLPASRKGQPVDAMTLNVDLFPTVLEMAGVPLPAGLHGRSLWPLLVGKSPADWRQDIFYRLEWRAKEILACEAVRTDRYKYVAYWPGGRSGPANPEAEQLFDLVADPHESRNLISSAAAADTARTLKKRWLELRELYPSK